MQVNQNPHIGQPLPQARHLTKTEAAAIYKKANDEYMAFASENKFKFDTSTELLQEQIAKLENLIKLAIPLSEDTRTLISIMENAKTKLANLEKQTAPRVPVSVFLAQQPAAKPKVPHDVKPVAGEERIGDVKPVAEEEIVDVKPVVDEEIGDVKQVADEEIGDVKQVADEEEIGDVKQVADEEEIGDVKPVADEEEIGDVKQVADEEKIADDVHTILKELPKESGELLSDAGISKQASLIILSTLGISDDNQITKAVRDVRDLKRTMSRTRLEAAKSEKNSKNYHSKDTRDIIESRMKTKAMGGNPDAFLIKLNDEYQAFDIPRGADSSESGYVAEPLTYDELASEREDKIIAAFVEKYGQEDGKLDENAVRAFNSLRRIGITDNSLLKLTEFCVKKGEMDSDRLEKVQRLKKAGALSDDISGILFRLPKDEDGKIVDTALQVACDLSNAGIGLPAIGEIFTVANKSEGAKSAICALSEYYPHEKIKMKEILPFMFDESGEFDKNASDLIEKTAKSFFDDTQKGFAQNLKEFDEKQKNTDEFGKIIKTLIPEARDKNTGTVSPHVGELCVAMTENGFAAETMKNIIDMCREQNGSINKNLAAVAEQAIQLGLDPSDIENQMQSFIYRNGDIDNEKAAERAETLAHKTRDLRELRTKISDCKEKISGLKAQIDDYNLQISNLKDKLKQEF